jgi:adenosine deaminase
MRDAPPVPDRPIVFLDYDGTLTPIVDRPEQATLSADMRSLLTRLAERCTLAIVSGRDRQNVQDMVRLDTLIYAGSHGFDIAGPEAAYPPARHLEAFRLVRREGLHVTIHAGESAGLESIRDALVDCGAERLGHGVRIVDDVALDDAQRVGRLAAWVRDRQVPLELCPTSNVHTGAAASITAHPFGLLRRLGFRVTVNTDNRLMSGVTLSSELAELSAAFGLGLADLEALQGAAAESLFAPVGERRRLVGDVIRPGFAALAAEGGP